MDWKSPNAFASKLTAGVILLGGLAAAYFALRPAAVLVDTAVVRRGPLTVTVEEEGKTRIKDVFVVSAPITGRLLRSRLEVGDMVEKNSTTVASIEPSPPPFLDLRTQTELQALIKASRAGIDLARAEVAQSRAELDFAQKEMERSKSLATRDVVSQRALEKARTDVETRRATMARADANLMVRQRELDSLTARLIGPEGSAVDRYGSACCLMVTAPVSGSILEVHKKSEQIVLQGTPLVEIGDPSKLEIVVELLSADAVRVQQGARATITAWGGPDLTATASRVEPAGFTKVSALGIEEQRVRVLLDLTPGPPADILEKLGHGFRVYVKIAVHHIDDALLVPLGALFRHGESWALFAVKNGQAELRLLEIGHRDAARAEVRTGLTAGDQIVLHPSDRVASGVRIARRAPDK